MVEGAVKRLAVDQQRLARFAATSLGPGRKAWYRGGFLLTQIHVSLLSLAKNKSAKLRWDEWVAGVSLY